MYRLCFALLVTGFVVVGAADPPPEECKFDAIDYKKDLALTDFKGAWHQIISTKNLGCAASGLLDTDEAKSTIKYFGKDGTFTYDKGVFKITTKTGEASEEEQAVVLTKKWDGKATAILYACKVVDKKKVVSAHYLNRDEKAKPEDAKTNVEAIDDVKALEWETCAKPPAGESTSSASFVVPHIATFLGALLLIRM
ncbi:uncharacterized protein [Epargyreus clarus]|uniref:uncharacterized protein n=1 Tax=Epargyreus clarus TaxID=520877 RepID=UPI003C2BE7F5